MKLQKIIRNILMEETTSISKEVEYLLGNQIYVDEIYKQLRAIHQNNPRNNKENILTFIQVFSKKLDTIFNQIFLTGTNAEKILNLINKTSDSEESPLLESESTSSLGFEKFNEYFKYMYYLYNDIQKVVNGIKETPTSDINTLKPKIERYYNLTIKDNNSMLELIKALFQYLKQSYGNISSGQTTKSTETQGGFNIDWSTKQIVKRYSDSTIIFLSPEKVLERVGKDMGSGFDIRNQGVRIGDRLEKAMEYLKNPNVEAYQPTMLYVESFEYDKNSQKQYYDVPKIGISDGRHRLLAAYNLGLKSFPFEVFNRDEEQQIKDLKYLESTLK